MGDDDLDNEVEEEARERYVPDANNYQLEKYTKFMLNNKIKDLHFLLWKANRRVDKMSKLYAHMSGYTNMKEIHQYVSTLEKRITVRDGEINILNDELHRWRKQSFVLDPEGLTLGKVFVYEDS